MSVSAYRFAGVAAGRRAAALWVRWATTPTGARGRLVGPVLAATGG